MPLCPKCGRSVAADAVFCDSCGMRLRNPVVRQQSPVNSNGNVSPNAEDYPRFITKIGPIIVYILSFIHFILFITAEVTLEGHPYGSPDKYGDYARGLYKSEVATIDAVIPFLWIIALLSCGFCLIAQFVFSKKGEKIGTETISRLGTLFLFAWVISIVCLIGTVWVTLSYSGYN